MRIDFGTKRHEHKESVSFKLPPWVLKIGAGIIGILVLVLFVSTLLSQAAASHPYAVFLFSKPDNEKPQASVQFLWIDEQKKQVTLINMPDDLEYTSTILGTYPVSSIYAARKLSSMSDTDFIRDLSFFFRMPVSGYVQTTNTVNGKLGLLSGLRTFCLNTSARSLSFSDCVHFVLYSWHPSTALSVTDLSENVFSPVNSSSMRPVDRDAYTSWRKRNLSYQLSGASQTSIAVINVSGKTGAASRVSSLFDDFGLHTLMVTDSKDTQESGIVYVQTGQKNAEVVRFIADLLHHSVEENDEKTKDYRSDIVVFIGEKEAKAFTP